MPSVPADVPAIRSALLDWYDVHARRLVWRAPPGTKGRPDPYRVWLSEVMLQQTTTPHATPYFLAVTTRWPTVSDLAAAEGGGDFVWTEVGEALGALPTVFRKALERGLA